MKHFLIAYDRRHGQVVTFQEFPDSTSALHARFQAERDRRSRDTEIVVLSAESEEALRRTHARYFKGVGELLSDLAASLSPAARPAV
jgi:hypothetical protein